MEKEFDSFTHRKDYGKTKKELARVKSKIISEKKIASEKTAEEIKALVEERERLIADLEKQRNMAEDEAREDNANFDVAHQRIHKLDDDILKYKREIFVITGGNWPDKLRPRKREPGAGKYPPHII